MTVPFAFIRIIYLNTFYDDLYYYQNALQAPSPNTGFTRRSYSAYAARPQRTHGAREDSTALPQRPHSALSNTLCKRRRIAFQTIAQRFHSVAGDCTARTSAFCNFFERCGNAVRTAALV